MTTSNMTRFPLDNWLARKRGYRFGEPTSYNAAHIGLDVSASVGDNLYTPTGGIVAMVTSGPQGGKTLAISLNNGWLIRFLHLDKILVAPGQAVEGCQLVGKTGNSGLSSGPHLHVDISKNGKLELINLFNFIDPESNLKNLAQPMDDKIIRNTKTGQFALVIRGKKYVFSANNDVLALITFMQRVKPSPFSGNVINVDDATFTSIPLSDGLKF